MNKKAQAQIITVVLIILLVLAAIIIVWQVIRGTVGDTSEELETRGDCIGADIEVASVFTGNISVRRNVGGPTGTINVKVIVDGLPQTVEVADLAQLQTKTITLSPAAEAGDTVEIAAIIGTVQCGVIDSGVPAY